VRRGQETRSQPSKRGTNAKPTCVWKGETCIFKHQRQVKAGGSIYSLEEKFSLRKGGGDIKSYEKARRVNNAKRTRMKLGNNRDSGGNIFFITKG